MVLKTSYPNFDAGITPKPVYDLNKWVNTMKNIYLQAHYGVSEKDAFSKETNGWGTNEKRDFENWIKYYKTKDYEKYDTKNPNIKTAQLKQNFYMNDDMPGYFLPNPKNSPPSPIQEFKPVSKQDGINLINKPQQLSDDNKRKLIEDQRRKMIGRLHSVEKLLTSPEGHIFSGKEFETLLNAVYELKKQIQTINKTTLANSIYSDLIIRKANLLEKSGCKEGSVVLRKIAQLTPGGYGGALSQLPLGDKIDGTGTLENPNPSIDSLTTPPPIEVSDDDKTKTDNNSPNTINPDKQAPPIEPTTPDADKDFEGLKGALDNLGTFGLTDVNKIEDEVIVDADYYPSSIVVESQFAPEKPIKPQTIKPETKLPNTEPKNKVEEIESKDLGVGDTKVDELIDNALQNVTIDDVIRKVENILSVYKRRELTRQLSTVDFMLDRLGLSSYFDNISEIVNKSSDANSYIATRLEDVLARLKGALTSNTVDLNPPEGPINPEALKVKQNLENQDNAEREKKELRNKVDEQNLANKLKGKEVPKVETAPEEIAAKPTEIAPKLPTKLPIPPK